MKIILLEFVDEAKEMLQKHGKELFLNAETKIICLHPKVKAYLKSIGIASEDPYLYLDNDAQHRIILTSEAWTVELLKDIKFRDSFGIEQGYTETCIHYLRLYINHFLWLLEILRGVCDQHSVSEIYVAVPESWDKMHKVNRDAMGIGYIQDQERYLGFLAKEFCEQRNIRWVETKMKTQRFFFKEKLLDWLAYAVAIVIARADYALLKTQISADDETIVVPALSYRMDKIIAEIKQQHPQMKCVMIWQGSPAFKRQLYKIYMTFDNFWKKMKKTNLLTGVIHLDLIKGGFKKDRAKEKEFDEEFSRLDAKLSKEKDFVCEGVSIAPHLRKKIKSGLKVEMMNLLHSTKVLADIFKNIHPKALMSMYSVGIYYMMGELASRLGFNALNISHGTHVPPNNEFEKIENYRLATGVISNTYPYVAVQTPWAEKFLDYYYDRRQRIYTGTLLYSVVNQTDRKNMRAEILGENHQDASAKIIVHATTQKGRASLRFHITETLDEYISAIIDIINAVNKLNNVYLVVRPHPVFNMSPEEFRLLLPECPRLKIIQKGAFSKILSAADMLISYSSTCIEEAIQNDISVILFDKWRRYNHFNVPEVRDMNIFEASPVSYVTRPELLDQCIKKVLFSSKPLFTPEFVKNAKYPKESRKELFKFIDASFQKDSDSQTINLIEEQLNQSLKEKVKL